MSESPCTKPHAKPVNSAPSLDRLVAPRSATSSKTSRGAPVDAEAIHGETAQHGRGHTAGTTARAPAPAHATCLCRQFATPTRQARYHMTQLRSQERREKCHARQWPARDGQRGRLVCGTPTRNRSWPGNAVVIPLGLRGGWLVRDWFQRVPTRQGQACRIGRVSSPCMAAPGLIPQ